MDPGEVIAPLDDSGAPGSAHLHLNRYQDLAGCGGLWGTCDEWMLNPLEYVQYSAPNYNITIHHQGDNITDPNLVPVGFTTANLRYGAIPFPSSPLMVRTTLPDGGDGNVYSDATFDIKEISLRLKNTLST